MLSDPLVALVLGVPYGSAFLIGIWVASRMNKLESRFYRIEVRLRMLFQKAGIPDPTVDDYNGREHGNAD